ncbi:hypothetical protein BDR07DRAFT_1383357 [Suillus spraguei]|nr:hypothetical protein BDR07DRAFT_1383357 [Suillus spraguei]
MVIGEVFSWTHASMHASGVLTIYEAKGVNQYLRFPNTGGLSRLQEHSASISLDAEIQQLEAALLGGKHADQEQASGPWAHGRNILVDDGWARRNIIPDDSGVDEWADVHEYPVDRWAEVVGYHVDGCIKVDVYQIDRWAQTHIKLDGY